MRSSLLAGVAIAALAIGCATAAAPPPAQAPAPTSARSAGSENVSPPPADIAVAAPNGQTAPSPGASQPAPAQTVEAPASAEGRGGRGRGNAAPPVPPPAVMPPPVAPIVSESAPSPDPRVGLAPGRWDAGQAAWNMRLVSTTPPAPQFLGVTNSDLAFTGKYVVQGNYNGFQVFDLSDPAKPARVLTYLCPASQSDVSVYKHLLFVSGEGQTGRLDCGIQGVPEPVSKDRLRGIRIFDISNITSPRYVANVQTCRGSHTHTVVTDPHDKENVYVYVSGSSRVRSDEELPGCKDGPIEDPNTARFRLEVIKVPLRAPEQAAIVSSPRIFYGLAPPPRRVEAGRGAPSPTADADPFAAGAQTSAPQPGARGAGAAPAAPPPAGTPAAAEGSAAGSGRGGRGGAAASGPTQCHDITVYPEIGLAGGACGGYGLLLDIREVAHPLRIDQVADINMAFWHSATFSNDGTKILFTDEWGGGTQPRCRETDKPEWGANALFSLEKNKMQFKRYFKLPAAQSPLENCVAHNGSLVPIPGREVMVQAWYQGGVSVFEWTDLSDPRELAYFDRGPLDGTRLVTGGSWSVYWYNGLIVSSEIQRGLDVLELLPSGLISQNELDAAKTVRFEYLNAQEQRKIVWPPSFAKARAYLDQIERRKGLAAPAIAAARTELAAAEKQSGQPRQQALKRLAARLATESSTAADPTKAHLIVDAVRELMR